MRKSEQYFSPSNKTKLLKILATVILNFIAMDFQATEFINVMMDECTDISDKVQMWYITTSVVLYR